MVRKFEHFDPYVKGNKKLEIFGEIESEDEALQLLNDVKRVLEIVDKPIKKDNKTELHLKIGVAGMRRVLAKIEKAINNGMVLKITNQEIANLRTEISKKETIIHDLALQSGLWSSLD